MSEVAARGSASRGGRGSTRGGRGGYSSRGGRGGSSKTGRSSASAFEDQGEIGHLKSKYGSSVQMIKEIFPQFTDEDIVVALEENGGDLETTINRISSGAVSQWEEAGKKDKPKPSKGQDGETVHGTARGSRGRGGSENSRGGRGKTGERGRGSGRGSAKAAASTKSPAAITETTAEPTPEQVTAIENAGAWGIDTNLSSTPPTWDTSEPMQSSSKASGAATAVVAGSEKTAAKANGSRSWADLMKPAPKPKPVLSEKPANVTATTAPISTPVTNPPVTKSPAPQELPAEPIGERKPTAAVPEIPDQVPPTMSPSLPPSEPAANIEPSEDKLTEENLEYVKDVSHPVATDTVASTVGTEDPRSVSGTPAHTSHGPAPKAVGGFATTALKATQGNSRSSFHRKLKEQSEAVVMPGNHAVDRATVQFGSLGLGGTEDIDDDREDAETRTQPPQHSPIAPRASLPSAAQPPAAVENAPTPRAAPGLTADPAHISHTEVQTGQVPSSYDQFSNRFGSLPATQASGAASVSKPYEPFGQQLASTNSHPFDSYAQQSQASVQPSQNAPSYLGGFGANDYGSYDFQRNQMYGGFSQQPAHSTQEQQTVHRAASGFGGSTTDTPPQHATTQAPQNRFGAAGDSLNSGHSTPAPGGTTQGGAQSQAHTQSHHMGNHGQSGNQGPYGSYYGAYNNAFYNQQMANQTHHQPYGRDRPAFDDARRYDDPYLNQNHHYGYGYGNYGAGTYGSGKFGGPNQYGISPQTNYDTHTGTSANTFGRETGPAGFGNYGRASSNHPDTSQQGQHSSSVAYGSMGDHFGRNTSSFAAQSSQQHGQQAGGEDASRYGAEASKLPTGGPSPAPNQQRPGSAANTTQTGPGGQSQTHAYGTYPHSGLGGFGGHQGAAGGHQGNYGNYGGGFGGGPYYGAGRGSTWGYGTS